MKQASGRHVAIAAYVKKRLTEECKLRGAAMAISRKTGFAPTHISNIIRGSRSVGYEFAYTMAEYWGMTYSELERITIDAQEALAEASPGKRRKAGAEIAGEKVLPNLQATIVWARGSYPDEFLDQFEAAAKAKGEDKPRKVWYAEIEAQSWGWKPTTGSGRGRRKAAPEGSALRPRVKRDGGKRTVAKAG
jgi:transcriptional regulator with XRE-family HTH domain